MLVIILFSIITGALSQPLTCPDIQPIPINFTAFAQGNWYEIAKYNVDFEAAEDCGLMTFERTADGVKFNADLTLNKKSIHFNGSVDTHDDIVFFHSGVFKSVGGVIPVKVLDVDYNSHFISYACLFDEKTKTKQDMAWIFSRTKTIDESTKARLQEIFHNKNIIDQSKFYWDRFTNEACLASA